MASRVTSKLANRDDKKRVKKELTKEIDKFRPAAEEQTQNTTHLTRPVA
jgi:signal recognition particle GTPase